MTWIAIPDWPYEVSDAGEVRRLGSATPLTPMRVGRKRKQYSVVRLCNGSNNWKDFKVHILVLEAFIGPRPLGQLGLHKDDDSWHNAVSNLYWGSHADNANDARYTKRKVTPAIVELIKRSAPYTRGLAKKFGISNQLICDIRKGRCYPLLFLLFVLVGFTRWDGHRVWINKDQLAGIQGGGQLGMHEGTLIQYGGFQVIVREDVNQVVKAFRDAK